MTRLKQINMFPTKMLVSAATGLAGAIGLALASAGSANATPLTLTLSAEDLVTSQVFTSTFTDSATPNLISLGAGSTGGIDFTGELATALVGGSPGNTNALLTSALTVTNSSTHQYQLTASLTGWNFTGPDNKVSLTGSGTWFNTPGSVQTLNFYDDPTNNGLAGTLM
jgi:hypothetical protein